MMKNNLFYILILFIISITCLIYPTYTYGIGEIIFSDNFTNSTASSSKWDFVSGNWIITDEHIECSETNNGNPVDVYAIAKGSDWTDYSFSFRVLGKEGVDKSVYFRFNTFNERYSLNLRSNYGVGLGGDISLGKQTPTENYHELVNPLPKLIDNDTWYSVKIEVISSTINIYIDDHLYITYSDPNPIIHGKIGLKVWPGGYASAPCTTTTWFDDVEQINLDTLYTPTPTPTPTTTSIPVNRFPIVLIPGYGGSWSLEGMLPSAQITDWGKMPYFYDHVYGPLINALNDNGYTKENHNLYQFFYDWRQKTDDSSQQLDNFMQNEVLPDQPPGTKINIIAHSYGGLVGRNWLQKYKSKHNNSEPPVNKIITAGTPHEGVVQTYTAWEGGEIIDNDVLKKFAFESILHFYANIFLSKTEALHQIAPSTLDLFPIFDFLKTEKGQIIPNGSMKVQNQWLKDLKNNLNENSDLKSYLNIFRGKGNNTMEYLTIKNSDWYNKILGIWQDGIPLKPYNAEETNEGDGMVLTKSAKIDGVDTIEDTFTHGGLVDTETGINKIFDILDLNQPLNYNANNPYVNNMLAFMLHSPACLRITDENNNQIGCNTIFSNPIPNADTDENKKTIFIINPELHWYQVEVIGTGTGNYELTTGQIEENKTNFNDFSGSVTPGSVETYLFKQTNGSLNLDDPRGIRLLISVRNKLKQLKEELASKPYPANKKTKIMIKIDKEIASIDNIIYLLNLKLDKKAALGLEKTIISLFTLSREFNNRNLDNKEDNIYFRKSIYNIIFSLRDVFVKIAVNISKKDRNRHLFLAKYYFNLFERRLQNKVRSENKFEETNSYLEIKGLLSTAKLNIYGNNFNKSYIDSIISKEFILNYLTSL